MFSTSMCGSMCANNNENWHSRDNANEGANAGAALRLGGAVLLMGSRLTKGALQLAAAEHVESRPRKSQRVVASRNDAAGLPLGHVAYTGS